MSSIILTSGVFDLIHPGHLEHFHEAKAKVIKDPVKDTTNYVTTSLIPNHIKDKTRLIVLLNSDSSILQLNRKFPPVFNQQERYILLQNIGLIDDVILFDEPTPCSAIRYIARTIRAIDKFEGRSPREIFYTKGGDYADQTIPEHRICEEEEISLFFTKAKINSSSNIYSKIKEQLL